MAKYFVLNDNALVYNNPGDILYGVLASSVDGPDPKNGPVAVVEDVDELRPAKVADFERFRVQLPEADFPKLHFRNPAYHGRRDDAANVVACVAYEKPEHGLSGQPADWVPSAPGILEGLDKLGVVAGVAFYGFA